MTDAVERRLSNLLVQMRQLEPGIQKLATVNNKLVQWNTFFSQLLTATSMQRNSTSFGSIATTENIEAIEESPMLEDPEPASPPCTPIEPSRPPPQVNILFLACSSSGLKLFFL
jgi:hypothetical protein